MDSGPLFKRTESASSSSESVESGSGSEERASMNDDLIKQKDCENGSNIHSSTTNGERFEYFGWVYHIRANSIGHEFCHLRFLFIRGKYVEMYKRDPHENPGIKPIRRGVIGHTLLVEELGHRKDVYVLRFYNRFDLTKKGEIGCATVGDARKWMEAFDHAKQQVPDKKTEDLLNSLRSVWHFTEVEFELSKGHGVRDKLNMEDEINLEAHRPRVRRYAHGLKRLARIGEGPEILLRKSSSLPADCKLDTYLDIDGGDVVEVHEWKCVRTINGVRIFEDVVDPKSGKGVLVKAVGVVDASADTVFEIVLSPDRLKRYEWDTLTGDLELVDSVNGHFDVVYGTFDPRYLTWRHSKRDFVFSRQWFRGQDGTYTILQFPSEHKKRPSRSGYKRTKINPSTWEISNLSTSSSSNTARCLVSQTLEINPKGWLKWRNNHCPKFEKTVPFALLSQVAGVKEYIGANPTLAVESSTTLVHSVSDLPGSDGEFEDAEAADEFYDAIAADPSSDDEDSDNDIEVNKVYSSSEAGNTNDIEVNKGKKIKLKNVSWAIASLALNRGSAPNSNNELNSNVPPLNLDLSQFHGSMRRAKDEADNNCWSCPDGSGFMIRGKTYLKDSQKVKGGEPLLKLIAVDWLKAKDCLSKVALHPKCLVQSGPGKNLPFILVVNLQVPARPNYSMVLYYAADRPLNKNSLLGNFVYGNDVFRDSRFKLIPSIVEGYWMVKRAVGTKACLLGKAVTCRYLRQDNFLEIDVDIGSSSVARSVMGLVLGYVTSIVVDLAIVIEAKEEDELPEHILGTVRLKHVQPDSAEPLEV